MFRLPNIENMLARSVKDSANNRSCGFKSHDMVTFYTHELHVAVYAERGFRVIYHGSVDLILYFFFNLKIVQAVGMC